MATQTTQLIQVRRGESVTLTFPVKTAAGVAINLTGYDFRFAVARKRGTAEADWLVDLDEGDGELSLVNVDGTNDGLQIALTTDQTDFDAGTYFWNLWVISGSTEKVSAEGPFQVLESLRRA